MAARFPKYAGRYALAIDLPRKMRGDRPFLFSNQKTGQGLREIIDFIERQGMLAAA